MRLRVGRVHDLGRRHLTQLNRKDSKELIAVTVQCDVLPDNGSQFLQNGHDRLGTVKDLTAKLPRTPRNADQSPGCGRTPRILSEEIRN